MQLFRTLHLILAFTLELALLAALGYWGFHNKKIPGKYIFGFGLPLVATALWWYWAAPKSEHRLQQPYLMIFKLVLFGVAAFGLYRSGQPGAAVLLAGLALLSVLLEYAGY